MIEEDQDLIGQLISAQWVFNDQELSRERLEALSEEKLQALSIEIEQIIKTSLERKDSLIDEVQLLSLMHVKMTIDNELTNRKGKLNLKIR
ncbi:hypothetical protein ABER99_20380 [Paenibacillus glucanolyticus]|jgi:hypothetical protein|uniref:Uncharacterized protein n=1 Tax=Paenibacillus glucanolyticus TaxID=59843 RepID=A0A163GIE1_9BACL|nr:hypothetical protein [Paenibacillus glucanolyticus]KZS44990.1 hypothetical protein AWU65_03140 [Paenibacillus glucanolyticus]OMF63636.1 hypothetical protein BK142_32590 [Paenibacillus glucanolyticus]